MLLREGRNKSPNGCDSFPRRPFHLRARSCRTGQPVSWAAGGKTPRRALGEAASCTRLGEGNISEDGQVLERARAGWQRSQGLAFKGTAGERVWPEVWTGLAGGPSPAQPGAFSRPGPASSRYSVWLCACGRTSETPAPRSVRPRNSALFLLSGGFARARVRGLVSSGPRAVSWDHVWDSYPGNFVVT